MILAQVRE